MLGDLISHVLVTIAIGDVIAMMIPFKLWIGLSKSPISLMQMMLLKWVTLVVPIFFLMSPLIFSFLFYFLLILRPRGRRWDQGALSEVDQRSCRLSMLRYKPMLYAFLLHTFLKSMLKLLWTIVSMITLGLTLVAMLMCT